MPRRARLQIPGVPLHIRQRGVNRQVCFRTGLDYSHFTALLGDLSIEDGCRIHAYVLMPNHVHLLASSDRPEQTARFMKRLTQRYAQHFNRAYSRTGHLWESRYRSSLVDSATYLLTCYRYIELNPVRAGLVSSAARYRWSSFAANALGKRLDFISPHPGYLQLGQSEDQRLDAYLRLFRGGISEDELALIRKSVDSNRALGPPVFIDEVERITGSPAGVRQRGRPPRTEKGDCPL